MTSGKNYDVTVTVDNKQYTLNNITFVQGVPAKIVVEDQVIPAGVATDIKYTVLDANGMDITNATKVAYTSTVTDGLDATNGTISLVAGATAFVKITCTFTNGTNATTITSDQFAIRAEAPVAKKLANYTVADSTPNFSAPEYKQDLNVLEDSTTSSLYVQLKDQFDADFAGVTTYESNDTSVAVVDKTTGRITPLKVGSFTVKISNGDFSQTVMVNVVPKAVIQKIVVKDTSLTIYPQLTNKSASTTVKLEDQYGKASYTGLTANIEAGQDLVSIDSSALTTDGTLTVTAIDATKRGTAVVKVGNGTFTQNIAVSLEALGTTVGYDVVGVKTTLDKNSSVTSTDSNYNANTMTISVNPVDKDGKISGDPSQFTFSVKEGNTEVVSGAAVTEKTLTIGSDGIQVGKTYTVTVKVGNMEVKSFQFNTVDTRKAPSVTVVKHDATITTTRAASVTNANDLATLLVEVGVLKVEDGCTVSNLKFVTEDSTAVTTGGAINGNGKIILQSIDITKTATSETFEKISLSGSVEIKVVNGVALSSVAGDAKTGVAEKQEVKALYEVEIITNLAADDKITIAETELTCVNENATVGTSFEAGADAAGTVENIVAALQGNMPTGYTVTGSAAKLGLTYNESAAPESEPTVTVTADGGSATGAVGDVIEKASYEAAVAEVKARAAVTIDTTGVAGTLKISVASNKGAGIAQKSVIVAANDSAKTIADSIKAAIGSDANYNVTVSDEGKVTIEAKTAVEGETLTITATFEVK